MNWCRKCEKRVSENNITIVGGKYFCDACGEELTREINHDFLCEDCDEPADYNFQNVNELWSLNANGDFVLQDTWDGRENIFYCEKCWEKANKFGI